MDEAAYRAAEARLWRSVAADHVEHRLALGSSGLRVRVQEVGEGPPVLFVHGVNTSGLSWAALAARLPGFRCLLLDRPGTGLSDPLQGAVDVARIERLADTLLTDVLDALDLPRASLVATSFGGYFALRAVAAHPARFDRMVQFSWPAGTPVGRIPAFMRLNSLPIVNRIVRALPPSERSIRAVFRALGHGPSLASGGITDEDILAYLGLLRHTDTVRHELSLGPVLISRLAGRQRSLLSEAELATVSTPTRFIWGRRDPFGGEAIARRLVALLPNAELHLLDAGHAPWLDALDRCAALTGEFLAQSS